MAAHFDCVPYSMAAWLGGGTTTVDVAPCMSISWAEIICNKKYNFLLQIISSAVRSKAFLILLNYRRDSAEDFVDAARFGGSSTRRKLYGDLMTGLLNCGAP